MKKVYLFLAVLGLSANAFAQNLGLKIFDKDHNEVTNGVYQIPLLHSSASTTDLKFYLTNSTSADLTVKARREVVVTPPGYEANMCFAGTCFTSDTTTWGQLLVPNELDSNFKISIFNFQNTTGDLSVNYYLYDENNPSNFVTLKIYYGNGLTASVAENAAEAISVSAFPNPASGMVNIKYNLNTEGQLLMTDITGKQVKNIRLNSNSQSLQVDISDLRAGVYIYSIQSGSKKIISKKLVVR